MTPEPPLNVGLFATCLVDLFRPNVGFAAAKLLQAAGCKVHVPSQQTCCGQPAFNSGDLADSRALAEQVITVFEKFDYTVLPSGSCAGMMRRHYPELFADDPKWRERAQNFADRCYELTSFLTDICHYTAPKARYPHKVTYHDSCSGMRELGVKTQPRQLLQQVDGLQLSELRDTEACCGFGGTFCLKYPEISARIVNDKIEDIHSTEADTVLAGDLGCLMNIAGRLRRLNSPVKAYHVAEVLADLTADTPAIGQSSQEV